MTRIVYVTIVSAYVIEYWVKANVARFSISRLEFSLLYMPHTFDSFYTLSHQRYRLSSFSMERPLSISINFTFTGNNASKLKRGNRERTSVNSKKSAPDNGGRWSEKDVGFIGPITFLSDLTVGPTYFAKSAMHIFLTNHCLLIHHFM